MIIHSHIFKSKIPKELRYPIKYSDVEASVQSLNMDTMYLSVYFGGYTSSDNKSLAQLFDEGRVLIAGSFQSGSSWWNAHHFGIEGEIPVVNIHVYALFKEAIDTFHITRPLLRDVLSQQIMVFAEKGRPIDQW